MVLYHIIDNIYLSNLNSALILEDIQKEDITIIHRLSEDYNKNIYPNHIQFYNYQLEDNFLYTYELMKYGEQIISNIENNQNKKILIHCNEGRSRSVSVIMLYLIIKKGYRYIDALQYIERIKPDINPNIGFKRILKIYNDLYQKNNLNIQEVIETLKINEYNKYKYLK